MLECESCHDAVEGEPLLLNTTLVGALHVLTSYSCHISMASAIHISVYCFCVLLLHSCLWISDMAFHNNVLYIVVLSGMFGEQ